MLFPGRKFPFLVDPKQIQWFWKVKSKRKKPSPHFVTFPPSIINFTPSLFRFSFFFPSSSFFPCLSFPCRSAEITQWEVSGGTMPPPAVTPLLITIPYEISKTQQDNFATRRYLNYFLKPLPTSKDFPPSKNHWLDCFWNILANGDPRVFLP